MQQGMPFGEAVQHFSLLTVGDGLVAQIPALLISVATGIIVTRAASDGDLGTDIANQILGQRKAPMVAGARDRASRSCPACRSSRSSSSAAASSRSAGRSATAGRSRPEDRGRRRGGCSADAEGTAAAGRRATRRSRRSSSTRSSWRSASASCRSSTRAPAARCSRASPPSAARSPPSSAWSSRPCASTTRSASTRTSTSSRCAARRSRAAGSWPGTSWRSTRATRSASCPALPTTEPAFGIPATWIADAQRAEAEALGYTVVDRESVIVTHLTEAIRAHAAELLTRQETRELLDHLKESNAAVVDEVVPDVLSLGEIQRVLQALLREGVSIRDLGAIIEAIGDKARLTRDPALLAEYARQALGRTITAPHLDAERNLRAIALDPAVEQEVSDAITQTSDGEYLAMEPRARRRSSPHCNSSRSTASRSGTRPVLLCSARVRRHLRRLCEQSLPQLAICSYNEIMPGIGVETVGVVDCERSRDAARCRDESLPRQNARRAAAADPRGARAGRDHHAPARGPAGRHRRLLPEALRRGRGARRHARASTSTTTRPTRPSPSSALLAEAETAEPEGGPRIEWSPTHADSRSCADPAPSTPNRRRLRPR